MQTRNLFANTGLSVLPSAHFVSCLGSAELLGLPSRLISRQRVLCCLYLLRRRNVSGSLFYIVPICYLIQLPRSIRPVRVFGLPRWPDLARQRHHMRAVCSGQVLSQLAKPRLLRLSTRLVLRSWRHYLFAVFCWLLQRQVECNRVCGMRCR